MKPQMIILMGGPGVGKGTLAGMLCDRFKFHYIEMGKMLRELAQTNPTVADILAHGDFIPDDIICDILQHTINRADTAILLDGFPRTLVQAQWLVKQFADTFAINVLFVDAPRDVIIQRIIKRRDSGAGRTDDSDMSIIEHRIDKFIQTTMPAVEYMAHAKNIQFHKIDGRGTPDENMTAILNALKK